MTVIVMGGESANCSIVIDPEGRKRKGRVTIGGNVFVLTQKPGS